MIATNLEGTLLIKVQLTVNCSLALYIMGSKRALKSINNITMPQPHPMSITGACYVTPHSRVSLRRIKAPQSLRLSQGVT